MGEVRHQREGPPRGGDLTEQPQGGVGIRVGDEPLRPVRQRLGPDPDRLQVIQARVEQRLDVAPEHRLAHDHRIPAGDQDAGHLGVLAEVGDQRADIIGGHLQLGLVHELRPPEAVGAVGVAGLALPGEEQHRLRVLVLQPRQRPAVQAGRVQQQLPGRMRVEPHPDLMRGFAQRRLRRLGFDQARPAGARLARAACQAGERRAGRSGRPGPHPSRSGCRPHTNWSGTAVPSATARMASRSSGASPARAVSMSKCFAEYAWNPRPGDRAGGTTCWMSVTRLLPRGARRPAQAPLHARNSPDDTRSPAVPPAPGPAPGSSRPELPPP